MAADPAVRPKLHEAGRLADFPSETPFRSCEIEGTRIGASHREKSGDKQREDRLEFFKQKHVERAGLLLNYL
jgi:hypothetical protein